MTDLPPGSADDHNVAAKATPPYHSTLTQTPTAMGTEQRTSARGSPPGTLTKVDLGEGRVIAGTDNRLPIASKGIIKFALGATLSPTARIASATLAFRVISAYPVGGARSGSTVEISACGSPAAGLLDADIEGAAVGAIHVPMPRIYQDVHPPHEHDEDVTDLVRTLHAAGAATVAFRFAIPVTQFVVLFYEAGDFTEMPRLTIRLAPMGARAAGSS